MKFSRVKGIIFQKIFILFHSLEDLLEMFFWPTLDLIVWGIMTTYFANTRGFDDGLIGFLLGGLILWSIVWRAQQDVSTGFLINVWNRNIINLFSTPLTPWEFILATVFLGLIKILITLPFLALLAFIFYSFNILSLGIYLVPFFVNLILFAWTTGIVITALIIVFGMRVQAFAWSLIAIFQPLSAVFYPVASLPIILQKISWFLPTAHIFEGMRQVLATGSLSNEHLFWALGLNIIYLIFATRFFTYMFEKAREKGKLVKAEI